MSEHELALRLIASYGCENFDTVHYPEHNCRNDPSRTKAGRYTGDSWCHPCIAADALEVANS